MTSHRVIQREAILPDGTRVEGSAWDRRLGVTCRFQRSKDGFLRCYPTVDAGAIWYYADKECSQLLPLVCAQHETMPHVVRWKTLEFAQNRHPLAPDEFDYAQLGAPRRKLPDRIYSKYSPQEPCLGRLRGQPPPPCRFYEVERLLRDEDFAVGIGYELDELTELSP